MEQASLVRAVSPEDRDGVLILLEMRHSEIGIGSFDRGRALHTLTLAIERKDNMIAGVISGEEGPEATIGLCVAQWWDSSDLHLQGIWDFVRPDKRALGHSSKLDQYAEMVSDRLGFPLVMGGVIRAGTEGKVRSYCKNYRPAGAFFMYDGPEMVRGTKKQREARASHLMQAFSGATG